MFRFEYDKPRLIPEAYPDLSDNPRRANIPRQGEFVTITVRGDSVLVYKDTIGRYEASTEETRKFRFIVTRVEHAFIDNYESYTTVFLEDAP